MHRFLSLLLTLTLTLCPVLAEEAGQPFKAEIENFESQDLKNPPPKNCTVFVGSSTFTLWSDLEKTFAEFKAVNRGFGGSTFPDINRYVDRIVNKYNPKKVVVYVGSNDIAILKHSGKDVFKDFCSFVGSVHKSNPAIDIYFISMSVAPSRVEHEKQFIEGNRLIQEYASRNKHLHYIDVIPVMRKRNGDLRTELFGIDRLHMNADGYSLWVPVIRRALSSSQ